MRILRISGFVLLAIVLVFVGYYTYHVHVRYRFTAITPNKVYRSSAMPFDRLKDYVKAHGIQTVIDLRIGNLSDPLNPGLESVIHKEKMALSEVEGLQYVNIPSRQIPSRDNLKQFFGLMDQQLNYPVLIHCHHGTGRAKLYSALYRMKYEGLSNEEARKKTTFPLSFGPFADGTPKGEWLKNFQIDRLE